MEMEEGVDGAKRIPVHSMILREPFQVVELEKYTKRDNFLLPELLED